MAVGLLGGWLPLAPVARAAATLTVTTLENSPTAPAGSCTLRDAIIAANGDTATGGCPKGDGADTIVFAAGLTGTLTLAAASGQLLISSDVAITGPGAGALTVSGNDATRVFYTVGGNVTIAGLTIARGRASNGAGIFVAGSSAVTLDRVALSDNVATSIGGAIAILGGAGVTVTGSTVSANQAADAAGGIAVEGTLTLANSTISGNTATNFTGGLRVSTGGSATLINATVADNVGPNGSQVRIGIAGGTLVAHNTIVAGQADTCAAVTGYAITDGGGNLDSGSSCGFGLANSNADLRLGVLANTGGPTQTILPGPGSAAIDRADNTVCADAPVGGRGMPR
jgi:CSLREA domain-containing protein